jgi:hypothetical protein
MALFCLSLVFHNLFDEKRRPAAKIFTLGQNFGFDKNLLYGVYKQKTEIIGR